jgi:AraC family transcriptional regulator
MLITPAKTPLELRWEGEENCVQIELSAAFVCQVANETLKQNGDRVQLMPTFQVKNAQMEAIARLLFTESQQTPTANQLYLDSLANVLAVELLRHHATTQPLVPTYEGGLPLYQLQQVLDYIDAHLTENLQLATLAQLLDLSQFHFSRLFKQSLGISPYQYLIQQRVERAQQLLQGRDRAITDIALDCGFSSSSHLSKQFRQVTGMTPTAYRAHCHPKGFAVK